MRLFSIVGHLRRRHRHRDHSRGQSLVELALILPVLLVLIAATLDLGRIFYSQITIANAAREGAMQAADTPTSFLANQACNKNTNKVMCRVVNEAKGSFVSVAPADVSLACAPACDYRDREHRHGQRERALRPDHPAAGWVPGGSEPDAHVDRRGPDRDRAGHQLGDRRRRRRRRRRLRPAPRPRPRRAPGPPLRPPRRRRCRRPRRASGLWPASRWPRRAGSATRTTDRAPCSSSRTRRRT